MTIVLYKAFTKRLNSTKQPPTPTDQNSFTISDAMLKGPCTLLRPVIEVRTSLVSGLGAYTQFVYCYIPEFSRYYFINSWEFMGARIAFTCEVDVLATYKSAITGSTQYVLRSASASDGRIVDTRYPVSARQPFTNGLSITNPLLPGANSNGCVVCGIVSKSGSITGCVQYWVFTVEGFMELSLELFNFTTQWGAGGQDIADGIKKAITDPFQYFTSCFWLPYSVTDFTSRGLASQTATVYVGYDTITLTNNYAYFFQGYVEVAFTNLIPLTLAKHPQASSRGVYLNSSPYSKYYFSFFPFCGQVELDSSQFTDISDLYCVYTVDLRTGKGILNLCTSYEGTSYANWKPGNIVFATEAQVGVDIPLAAIHTALPQSLAPLITGTVASAVSESGGIVQTGKKILSTGVNWFGSLIGASDTQKQDAYNTIGAQPYNMGDVSKIGSLAMKSECQMLGGQGTMAFNYRQPLRLWGVFYYVTDEALTWNGRPLCQQVQLSTLAGYVCCDKPSIPGPAYALTPEVAEIENYLASGCFLE